MTWCVTYMAPHNRDLTLSVANEMRLQSRRDVCFDCNVNDRHGCHPRRGVTCGGPCSHPLFVIISLFWHYLTFSF